MRDMPARTTRDIAAAVDLKAPLGLVRNMSGSLDARFRSHGIGRVTLKPHRRRVMRKTAAGLVGEPTLASETLPACLRGDAT
jgi:hypothetical protein